MDRCHKEGDDGRSYQGNAFETLRLRLTGQPGRSVSYIEAIRPTFILIGLFVNEFFSELFDE